MSTPPAPSNAELCTWQEIATYLGVSVSQAQKWEKQAAMPVHRFPGGSKARVLAYPEELDTWKRSALQSRKPPPEALPVGVDRGSPITINLPRFRLTRRAIASGFVVVALVGVIAVWILFRTQHTHGPIRAEAKGNTLTAFDEKGQVLWTYTSSREVAVRGILSKMYPGPAVQVTDLDGDGSREVVFVSTAFGPSGAPESSDELSCLSAKGQLLWRYIPNVAVTMGDTSFKGPWNITDIFVAAGGGAARIWISLAHWSWRPGAVVALTATGTAEVKFVNAGHLYAVSGFSAGPNRYIVAGGVNNEYTGAAVAILREDAALSCSPQTSGSGTSAPRSAP
jgi:hypothetical protein